MLKREIFFELAILRILIYSIGGLAKLYLPTVISGIFNCLQLMSLLVGGADNG